MNGNNKSVFLKKILIVLSILIFLNRLACAQVVLKTENVHLGFKLNPTFGYLKLKDQGSLKSDGLKLGFSFAGTADYLFTKNLGLSTEFAISTINGGTVSSSMVSQTQPGNMLSVQKLDKILYKIAYLELPLALKIRTNTIGEAALLYLKFGIDPAFKLASSSVATSSTDGIPTIIGGTNDARSIRFFRASFLAGLGYDYRFNRDFTFTSGLLFNNGFTRINKADNVSITNSFLAIEFGVYF